MLKNTIIVKLFNVDRSSYNLPIYFNILNTLSGSCIPNDNGTLLNNIDVAFVIGILRSLELYAIMKSAMEIGTFTLLLRNI